MIFHCYFCPIIVTTMHHRTFIFSVFLLFLVFHSGLAQEMTNQTDDRGRKQGSWEARYPQGGIRYKGQFRNDKPYGEFRYFHPSGNLRAIQVFSDNGRIARNKTYAENGFMIAEGKYIDQKKDSVWRFYSDIDGNLLSEESYLGDKRHGVVKNYYPENGKISEIINYESGIRNGDWLRFFDDGVLMSRGFYVNDLLHGAVQFFYPDGKLHIKGQYVEGMKDGIWEYFTPEGKPDYEEHYTKGMLR